MYGKKIPFRVGVTFATFRNAIANVVREIDAQNNEYIRKASETELEDYYVGKVLINPIELDSENYYVENQQSIRKDVSQGFSRMSFRDERIVAGPGGPTSAMLRRYIHWLTILFLYAAIHGGF